MMTNPRKWNIIIRSRFCLLENLSRMQLVTVFRVKEGLVVMIMVKAGGLGGDWRWWKMSCRKKGMLILLVISHLYDQLLDLHPLAEYCYCCPILFNLGRIKGEEDSDEDSDKEDSDDEDGVEVLVIDEDSARIH
jgi:hypothetical protein